MTVAPATAGVRADSAWVPAFAGIAGGLRLAPLVLLAGCAATQSGAAVQPQAPGFLLGLWHGFIFPVAWFVSLFMPDVSVYAVPNNGGWYDFGYFIGIVFLGVGARKTVKVPGGRDSVTTPEIHKHEERG